ALMRMRRRRGVLGKALAVTAGVMLIRKAATGRSRVYTAIGVSSASLEEGAGINIETDVTIKRSREELYQFWSDITNLPLVMRHLDSVELRPDGTSHWKAKGPRDVGVEWDAEPINSAPNEFIAWKSLPGSQIENSGSVRFRDAGDDGTEVHVKLRYVPPGMEVGFALAKVMNPVTEAQVAEDLRRFKHLMETETDVTTEGQRGTETRRNREPGYQRPESEAALPETGVPSETQVGNPGVSTYAERTR
ncbi:MAG TPA: SRPBCC family protein, partial [Coriobacteriia bacterium]|nr:SRPBCC family protein [Coriobacteriia bacterium]